MQESIGTKVLPIVQSMIAGSVDVIGFLELGGLTGERARRTGIAIAGFVLGCGLGAWCQARAGLLTLPNGLSLVALAMSPAPKRGVAQPAGDLGGELQDTLEIR
jgi:uncharacterized membrane protein YoaK (UPF0700 family)